MLTIYDRMSQSRLIWGKNMKMEKTPTKTTKLPIILNNFKLCPFNVEIVKNGWKETCVWFTLKLEFFLTLFFQNFQSFRKTKTDSYPRSPSEAVVSPGRTLR